MAANEMAVGGLEQLVETADFSEWVHEYLRFHDHLVGLLTGRPEQALRAPRRSEAAEAQAEASRRASNN